MEMKIQLEFKLQHFWIGVFWKTKRDYINQNDFLRFLRYLL